MTASGTAERVTTPAPTPTPPAPSIPTITSNLIQGSTGTNVSQLQQQLNALGYVGANGRPLTVDGIFGANTLAAVNAFKDANIPAWNQGANRGVVGPSTFEFMFSGNAKKASNDINPSPTPPPNKSNIGFVQLPQSGTGYIAYSSADKRWGTPETIASVQSLGNNWAQKNHGTLSIGNISLQEGGSMPPHRSHQLGVDVDIRPIRNDGKAQPLNIQTSPNDYSQDWTRTLIREILATGNVDFILFNDSVLIGEFREVRYSSGHYDHLHVRYKR
jgi:peptidoglycan hydrolase-like protein with peptidoglycan-binding domain